VHKRVNLDHALPQGRFIHTHIGFGYRLSAEALRAFHIVATAR